MIFYDCENVAYSAAFSSLESAASAVGSSVFGAYLTSATAASAFGAVLLLLLVTFFSSAFGL